MTDYQVKPMGRADIREIVTDLRRRLRLDQPYIDVLGLIDVKLSKALKEEEYELQVLPDDHPDVSGQHAHCCPRENRIVLTDYIYDLARNGDGFGRMTVVHEMGHLVLHRNVNTAFARATAGNLKIKPYLSAEWQAKAFAGEFMMPVEFLNGNETADEMALIFGVTNSAARTQRAAYVREGLMY